MSLPVWDVCQASVQKALDYFIHVVLEIPAENNTLTEWLRNRKLPYLVHEPLTAEMVFLSKGPFSTKTQQETIRKRQATFLGHVMRRGKLEHLVTTGKFEGKRSRGRQREKIMDGLATWLGPGKV
ncbi:hypothetical protein PoB_003906400 [Plakobranchus ocellatus]|uniref:Uncharacterized protein n=1 Tax=Plakobranchus ocellatus TaxID=259542 RepID=A0AAV4AXQ6_9GAST|nr:hypothetical protein PoB_003906400 [Plakobranchus ocellatus]